MEHAIAKPVGGGKSFCYLDTYLEVSGLVWGFRFRRSGFEQKNLRRPQFSHRLTAFGPHYMYIYIDPD